MEKEPYTLWVLDWVRLVKLPFDIYHEYKPEVPEAPPMSLEEIEKECLETSSEGERRIGAQPP